MMSKFISKLYFLISKKNIFLVCNNDFLNFDLLEKHLFLYDAYIHNMLLEVNQDELNKSRTYLYQLSVVLFSEKHDSPLVKELLLWFLNQDSSMQSTFHGSLVTIFSEYSFFEFTVFEKRLFYVLNLYRLGFEEVSFVRSFIWYGVKRGRTYVGSNVAFKDYLANYISKYKSLFFTDEHAALYFDNLINHQWSEKAISSENFDKG